MNTKLHKSIFLALFTGIIFAACSGAASTPEAKGPEEVYWDYWTACQEGSNPEAEGMLTAEARVIVEGNGRGICSLTHDFVYRTFLYLGPQEKLPEFSSVKPEVSESEEQASLMWLPDEGVLVQTVILKNIDGEWKLHKILFIE